MSAHGADNEAQDQEPFSPAQHAFNHLVMVAGHSVYTGRNFADAKQNSNWFLVPYQQVAGTAESFVQHIEAGVKTAADDDRSVLVFSGGYTRGEAGARSEAGSYWNVANAFEWFGKPDVESRALLEDRARDSLENLLFSMCRFRQFTGRYPTRITVVSYDFKRKRFTEQHAKSLGFPLDRVVFIGTRAPDPVSAHKGEAATLAAFEKDNYACQAELSAKRRGRDPFRYGTPTATHCPALKPFMTPKKCMKGVYSGDLPWREQRFRRSSVLRRAPQ